MRESVRPIESVELDEEVGVEHQHAFQRFDLPGEAPGRVYQCTMCKLIGHRRERFIGRAHAGAGIGKIYPYTCSKPGCGHTARARLPGRGPRGFYLWVCEEHSVTVAPK